MKVFTIIAGVLLIVAGFFCLFSPGITFLSMGWLLGLMLLISGISLVIDYIALRGSGLVGGLDLVFGLIGAVLGVVLLANQGMRFATEMMMLVMLGIWMVVGGIIRIVQAIRARSLPGSLWRWTLFLGILMVLVGVYSFFQPLAGIFGIAWLFGFYLLLAGMDLVSFGASLHKVEGPNGEKHWRVSPM